MAFDKLVVVTRKTQLEELVERFNTVSQARFYIEHAGVSFGEYEASHQAYARSLAELKRLLPRRVKQQFVDRSLLPTFTFGPKDLVITLGPDGLVVNTAKYLDDQPIVALNPDPERIDGVLNPLVPCEVTSALDAVASARARVARVTMARVSMADGRELVGFNDLFIGPRTHVCARYALSYRGRAEQQMSSGLVVSTGAGSTGWLQSIVDGGVQVAESFVGAQVNVRRTMRFDWESDELRFCVREPFTSRVSKATLVAGTLASGEELTVTSQMPDHGVVFSDGVETDYLPFNSGAIARVGLAPRKAHLVQRSW